MPPRPPVDSARGLVRGLALAALAGLATGCGDDASPPSALLSDGSRPNVLVYLIDTLRADHLGCYGYGRDTSPTIDALADESLLFERAQAQASWTKPSVASLFTGLLPSHHGAVRREHALRAETTTLAEALGAEGYATAAIVTNPNVLPAYGFDAGFERFIDLESVQRSARAAQLHEVALDWLDRRDEAPFFLYLHGRDPHEPYAPPPPFDTRFPGDGGAPTPNDLYDGEIAYWDAEMAVLLDGLRERGLLENTVLVLLSDHGEEFGDHGGIGHGKTLYQEQLHVPLLIRLPGGREARRVERPVRVVDVAPTLYELLELAPPEPCDGASFAAAMVDRGGYAPLLFAELNHDRHLITSFTEGRYKLIRSEVLGRNDAPAEQLFDLARDPGERADLSSERADVVSRLRGRLGLIESALNHGLYLEFNNELREAARHGVRGTLEVQGGSIELFEPGELEDGDAFRLSPDRTRIEFALTLANVPNPIGQAPRFLRDVDRARLTVTPAGARVELVFEVDGAPPGPRQLIVGPRFVSESPVVVGARDEGLVLPTRGLAQANPVLSEGLYARLHRVPPADSREVEIDAELDRRLSELGYAGDD